MGLGADVAMKQRESVKTALDFWFEQLDSGWCHLKTWAKTEGPQVWRGKRELCDLGQVTELLSLSADIQSSTSQCLRGFLQDWWAGEES